MRFTDLQWREAPLPGGSGPVQLALLPRLPDNAFRAFVRFPPGWSRPEAGHYPDAEEFLVLDGELRLNGTTWGAGGYAWIPARCMRRGLQSGPGCLVFAWFASPPRWIPGPPASPAESKEIVFRHWREAPGGLLYEGAEHRTWIADGSRLARLGGPAAHFEILDLPSRAWRWSAPGGPC